MFDWVKIISLIKCPYNNAKVASHSHLFYQLIYVLEGSGEIEYQGEVFELNKNDFFLVGYNNTHSINGKDMLTFEVKFGISHDYYKELLDKTVKKENDHDNKIRRMIDKVEHEIDEKGKFYIDFIRLEFMKILLTCIKTSEESNERIKTIEDYLYTDDSKNSKFGEVTKYIKENYNKKITLEELSAISCMGTSGFIKKFKQLHGISPMQYVNRVRFLNAKEMLKNTNMTVTEIAEKSGFGSLHYFSRYFTKNTGVTPKDFRDKTINKYKFNIDLPM